MFDIRYSYSYMDDLHVLYNVDPTWDINLSF